MPTSLYICKDVLEALLRHAEHDYPSECCGILIGYASGRGFRVVRVQTADNIAERNRTRAYQIDWQALFEAVRAVRNTPERIIGFYHSHPDGSDSPSLHDTESPWVDHSYVIIPVADGVATKVTSWRSRQQGNPFERERVECV